MEKAKMIPVSYNEQFVTDSGPVESNCAGITFFNEGVDTFTVKGKTVVQGAFVAFSCNVGEIDQTNYVIQFAGADPNQKCLVVRKNVNIQWEF